MNTYAKAGRTLGGTAADKIVNALGGQTAMGAKGYSEGVDAGTLGVLRHAQAKSALANAMKTRGEADRLGRADKITGLDIAEMMGVNRDTAQRITAGDTQMPGVMPGGQEGPARPMAIPQDLINKTQRANTMRILQKLNPSVNPGDLMGRMQKQGLADQMISGSQKVGPVAEAMAAIEGKTSPAADANAKMRSAATGGKAPAAKVQEMNHLMSKSGGGMTPKEAAKQVYGDKGATMYANLYGKMYSLTYDEAQSHNAAMYGLNRWSESQGAGIPEGWEVNTIK